VTRERALVLGGGGVAGVAWITGVLAGLKEAGADVTGADFVLGTSAGAMVGAQVASGADPSSLLRKQVEPGAPFSAAWGEAGALARMNAYIGQVAVETPEAGERLRRLGQWSLGASAGTADERRGFLDGFLPCRDWPDRDLAVVAINAATGAARGLDRACGVDLVDAVAASSAVPGLYPPVGIGSFSYFDGGLRSYTNLDLAAGYRRILVVAPFQDPALDRDAGAIVDEGGLVQIISPDEQSLAAFGTDSLDPAVRVPCARAGYRQGRALARSAASFWLIARL
jgi:NTE family protein